MTNAMTQDEIPKTKFVETDELDRQILALLHSDARTSSSRIAEQLQVTDRTIRNRIEKFLSNGLAQIGLLVDQQAAGYPVTGLIHIDVEVGESHQVAQTLAKERVVNYVATCLGEWDVTVQVYFHSNAELRDWVDTTVGEIEGVRGVKISILPRIYKRPTDWFPSDW